jgi:hypothetical protein
MVVDDFRGVHEVSNDAEIGAILTARDGQGANEIWLSHETDEYPAILILANGDLACVHYFPKEFDPGYQSVGPAPGLDPKHDTMFFVNAEQLPMSNRTVVPFSLALEAAIEFHRSRKLPICIKWIRL